MNRASNRFRPCLDVFDKKTLLSAGQLSHLAGALHGAVPSAEKYKVFVELKDPKNGGQVFEAGALTADVDGYTRTNPRLKPGDVWTFEIGNLTGASPVLNVYRTGGARILGPVNPTGHREPVSGTPARSSWSL